jgi:hypothetical protein
VNCASTRPTLRCRFENVSRVTLPSGSVTSAAEDFPDLETAIVGVVSTLRDDRARLADRGRDAGER